MMIPRTVALAFSCFLLHPALHAQSTQPPVILFTDLTSGPSAGNSDTSQAGQIAGQDGAIVTVWGKYLGTAPGSITVGGRQARLYSWGNATAPANLYAHHDMQMVSFQIPHGVPNGATAIQATAGGVTSNTLPFTVQPGNIYFVKTNGSDTSGDGSWNRPWATLPNAVLNLAGGDILYACDGVSQTAWVGDDATFDLENYVMTGSQWASQGNPKALVAYPNANVTVGSPDIQQAYSAWPGGGETYSVYWTISKLSLTAQSMPAIYNAGFRLVGNHMTAPSGDGETGAIAGGDSTNLAVLGNELTTVGSEGCSKLYHVMYIQSLEADSGPRLPDESNREIGWNYIHDNNAYVGINIYREGVSSAYMLSTLVHDNFIMNQSGSGMLIGEYVVGPSNYIYNNVIINAGLGPVSNNPNDPVYEYECVDLIAGYPDYPGTTVIHFYNNTLYGCGFTDTVNGIVGGMVLYGSNYPFLLDFRNNVVQSTGLPYVSPDSSPLPAHSGSNNVWFGQGAAPDFDIAPISADPLLVNPAPPAGNAHLQSGSPAIAAGSTAPPLTTVDFDNIPRVNPPSIGAFEYATPAAGSSGPSTPAIVLALGVSASQVNLAWAASTDPNYGPSQIGYWVYRNGTKVGATAGLTGYSDIGLAPSTTYIYSVAAVDPAGLVSSQAPAFAAVTQPNGNINVADVQLVVNQALGTSTPGTDLNGDGVVNVVDVEISVNAVLASHLTAQ